MGIANSWAGTPSETYPLPDPDSHGGFIRIFIIVKIHAMRYPLEAASRTAALHPARPQEPTTLPVGGERPSSLTGIPFWNIQDNILELYFGRRFP